MKVPEAFTFVTATSSGELRKILELSAEVKIDSINRKAYLSIN